MPHMHIESENYLEQRIEALEAASIGGGGDVEAAVAELVAGAPDALNTLNELAAALGDDANFAATVATSIANQLTTAEHASIDHEGLPGVGSGGGGAATTYGSKAVFVGGGITVPANGEPTVPLPLNLSVVIDGADVALDADTFSINFLNEGIYALRVYAGWGVVAGETLRRRIIGTYTSPDPATDTLASIGWLGAQAEGWVHTSPFELDPVLCQVCVVAYAEAGSSISFVAENGDPTETSEVTAGNTFVMIQRVS